MTMILMLFGPAVLAAGIVIASAAIIVCLCMSISATARPAVHSLTGLANRHSGHFSVPSGAKISNEIPSGAPQCGHGASLSFACFAFRTYALVKPPLVIKPCPLLHARARTQPETPFVVSRQFERPGRW